MSAKAPGASPVNHRSHANVGEEGDRGLHGGQRDGPPCHPATRSNRLPGMRRSTASMIKPKASTTKHDIPFEVLHERGAESGRPHGLGGYRRVVMDKL